MSHDKHGIRGTELADEATGTAPARSAEEHLAHGVRGHGLATDAALGHAPEGDTRHVGEHGIRGDGLADEA